MIIKRIRNDCIEYGYYTNEDKFIRHRDDDLPAVISKTYLIWFQHDINYRDKNPNLLQLNEVKKYWQCSYTKPGVGFHRTDGPAILFYYDNDLFRWYVRDDQLIPKPDVELRSLRSYFCVNGNDISSDVNDWRKANRIPNTYKHWKDHHKLLFKLTFG